ncbi:hypothetical protein sos41_14510 [Alphaproteobacteria bacterium SO-S41]|nr:hypothetical protein sos41_14510 [Alphaproteobacteria bacterium SO-S41]
MRVFLTGATGFIGSAVARELQAAGHQVIGMTRSDDGAKALKAAGVEPHHATLTDFDALKAGVAKADGVIHLAFIHDFGGEFSAYKENCEVDRRAVAAMGAVLAGSDRPFVVTSGITTSVPGELAVEDGVAISSEFMPRAASEEAANAAAQVGANVSVVRLPQVHDTAKQGLVTPVIGISRAKGVSAYIGDGANRWPAAHISDVARLYRLALERAEPDAKYHAVAEEGVSAREIAEALGRRLKLPVVSLTPEQAPAHFGMLAFFAGADMPASSEQTKKVLGWAPTGSGLIADLDRLELAKS